MNQHTMHISDRLKGMAFDDEAAHLIFEIMMRSRATRYDRWSPAMNKVARNWLASQGFDAEALDQLEVQAKLSQP